MPAPPTGTVTFLFTDVEQSTAHWEEHPVAMDAALRLHDGIVRRCVDGHAGFVFSTAGDGFGIAFATAHAALEAAVDIQRALARQAWPNEVTLRVRMALDTGEANERDGDYFGRPLNRAARLMATAHGGQIICSSVTAGLLRDWPLLDLGVVRLKDLSEPQRVFQPIAAGLEESFPPLRSLDRGRHNLPTQPTVLIGRDADVGRVVHALGSHRLVTLTGAGGCGKTRLALAVAAEVVDRYADGVFLVELAEVGEGSHVYETVAATLGLALAGGTSIARVARFLANQELLLVLDNCEHVVDEVASLVDGLLKAGSKACVLATSRQPLDVDGEQAHRVPPLDASSALALLVERASAASDEFRLPPDDEPNALELCERLDGMPLAIELAAGHLVHLTPGELLRRLDRRFDLLVGGRRHSRPRQQTLQGMMDWSWDRLDRDEQIVLAALTVFSGGWTVDAAEGVCSDLVEKPVATILRSLAAKSMINPVRTAQGTRFRLLETVRLFAKQKLLEQGRNDRARAAHQAWFVGWARAGPLDERLFWQPWIRQCVDDLDNLDAAFGWSLDHALTSDAVTLHAATMGPLHWIQANSKTYQWTKALLAREIQADDELVVLIAGTMAAVGLGDHAAMETWGAQAELRLDRADPCLAALILVFRGAIAVMREPDRAAQLLSAAHAAAQRSGSLLTQGYVKAWQLHADLCTPEGRAGRRLWRATDYGGAQSIGWMTALQAATIHEARIGNLGEAQVLRSEFENFWQDRELSRRIWLAHDCLLMALAAEPAVALEAAQSALHELDRTTDAVYHPEMVLVVAIAHARAGDGRRALTYLEALRRAPMYLFIHYDLRRDFSLQMQRQLEDREIADARAAATHLNVESILDRELRTERFT